ncbi:nuclear transport factor 2 family protein [Actinomadura rubrisoli]|uniref:Nuclear transport factor 2 family protein n=1 Tax=Actinomadura rubrisoli TaxID=2530368 RepID=A0A4R5BQX3_9ACTN|nr:nuclear transport factor 2 family protein [Actinomadura rubrisoli]TDD87833.1 nuclear transport factor 2 family protein [Actinomadura rubrisoli]
MPAVSDPEIARLCARYSELIDAGDFARAGALFHQGTLTIADTPITATGSTAVQQVFERFIRIYSDDGTPHTKHVTTNLVVDADGASAAAGRSYFTVFQRTDDLPLQAIMVGGYEDRYQIGESGWGFAHRRIRIDHVGDVSRHLLRSLHG